MKRNLQEHRQITAIFATLQLFGMLLILLQLWSFVSVLEALVGGEGREALVFALVSIGLLTVNLWMLRAVTRLSKSN